MEFGFDAHGNSTGVVVLSGRAHYYEGYTGAEVTLGIRELAKRGVDRVILTNAAGGINLYGARMGAYPVDPTVFLDF